jgi:hypothetical protein
MESSVVFLIFGQDWRKSMIQMPSPLSHQSFEGRYWNDWIKGKSNALVVKKIDGNYLQSAVMLLLLYYTMINEILPFLKMLMQREKHSSRNSLLLKNGHTFLQS